MGLKPLHLKHPQHITCTHSSNHAPTHAQTHAQTHARPGLPVNQNPILTPPYLAALELHYSAAAPMGSQETPGWDTLLYFKKTKTYKLIFPSISSLKVEQ